MLKITVYNKEGKQTGHIDFDEKWLGGVVRKKLLKEAVLMYEANSRQGTHKSQSRAETTGSGKKMYRQKGTGMARMGAKRTHKRRGGGTAFGPFPRDYSYDINKKARRAALESALLGKMKDQEILAVEDFGLTAIKTKDLARTLKNLKIDSTCLIGIEQPNETVFKSARNIPGVSVLPVFQLNAYDVVHPKRVLLTKAAAQALKDRYSKGGDNA